MLNIGCHLSTSKGFYKMGKDALNINANTFQFFTRNPRGSRAKDINLEDIKALLQLMKENDFTVILAHAPYTLNPCSSDKEKRSFAMHIIADDLKRMEYLPYNLYNLHPGNHMGQGVDVGIEHIVNILNTVIKPEQTTTVLLETMAGKGTEIGSSFKEIKKIIDGIKLKEKLGVCLDICHVYAAGYDIVNNLDGVLNEFDNVIGLDRLCAIHLNDSMNPIGSHKDRHQKIDKGFIGLEAIARIINHPALCNLPFILETPNDLNGYAKEIELIRSIYDYN